MAQHVGLAGARILAGLVLLGLLGCSSNRPYPVKGTVFFEDGQPAKELVGTLITFQPTEEGKPGASGTVDSNGNYVLAAQKPKDGAFPGQYKVALTPPLPPDREEEDQQIQRQRFFHPRYQEPAHSGLVVTVEAKSNDIPITIERLR